MRARSISALLLDMDGTIVDSEPRHIEAHREFLAGMGLSFDYSDLHGNIGKSDRQFYRAIAAKHGLDVDVASWLQQKTDILIKNYLRDGLAKRPGVDALLQHAWNIGLCCCVVTSSERRLAHASLTQTGLADRLPIRICHEDTEKHKPDPAPYLLAAQRLSVPIRNCLAIEDSVSGVRSAATAGATVVGSTSLIPADELLAAGAARCVSDLSEILPLSAHFGTDLT